MEEKKELVVREQAVGRTDMAPGDYSNKKEVQKLNFQDEITKLIPTAGTIELTAEQKQILYASVKDEDVEIRPDGLVYLPWMEYVARLRDAFGAGWAIIPQGMPTMKDNYILWPFFLVIQGKIAGFSVGEQAYQPSNARMTYGDALEGAKSNALMRLSKGLGISLELWKPAFVRGWKKEYAESYMEKGKTLWRKKASPADEVEEGQVMEEPIQDSRQSPPPLASSIYEELYKRVFEIKNIHELKNWFDKHKPEILALPKEQKDIILDAKDSMKKKFEEVKE